MLRYLNEITYSASSSEYYANSLFLLLKDMYTYNFLRLERQNILIFLIDAAHNSNRKIILQHA